MADGMETFLTRRLAVVWLVSTDVAYLDYVSGKKSPSAAAVDCGMAKAWLRETWKNESLKPQDVSIIAGEIAKGGVKMIPGTINYKVSHLLSSFPSCVEWALSFLSGDLSGPRRQAHVCHARALL